MAQLSVEEVNELRELSRGLTSLDQPVGEDGETALGDLLAAKRPEPSEEVAPSGPRAMRLTTTLPEATSLTITIADAPVHNVKVTLSTQEGARCASGIEAQSVGVEGTTIRTGLVG